MTTEHGHSSIGELDDNSAQHFSQFISSSTMSDSGNQYYIITNTDRYHSAIDADQYQSVFDVTHYQRISTQYRQLLSYEQIGASITPVQTSIGVKAVNHPPETKAGSCSTRTPDNIHSDLSKSYFANDNCMLDCLLEPALTSNAVSCYVDVRQLESAHLDADTSYKPQPMPCENNEEDRQSLDNAVSGHYEQIDTLNEDYYDEIPVEQHYSEVIINDDVEIQVCVHELLQSACNVSAPSVGNDDLAPVYQSQTHPHSRSPMNATRTIQHQHTVHDTQLGDTAVIKLCSDNEYADSSYDTVEEPYASQFTRYRRTIIMMVALMLFIGTLLSTIVDSLIQQQQQLSTATTGEVDQWELFSARTFGYETDTGSIVTFNQMDFNYGQAFYNSVFTPQSDGYFWFYMSHNFSNDKMLDVTLVDSFHVTLARIQASQSIASFGVLSLSSFVKLNKAQSIHVENSLKVNTLSVLMGFRFDSSTMNPFVVYQESCLHVPLNASSGACVASTDTYNFIDVGWNVERRSQYKTTPVSGVYIVYIAAHVQDLLAPTDAYTFMWYDASFNINFETIHKTAIFMQTYVMSSRLHSGKHNLTASMCYLLNLTKGERLKVTVGSDMPPQSTLTTLFLLYSPARGPRAAWSMTLFSANSELCTIDVSVNTNVSCDDAVTVGDYTANNSVHIMHSGIYYISLTVETNSAESSSCVFVFERQNDGLKKDSSILCSSHEPYNNLTAISNTSSISITTQNANLKQLQAGNVLSVALRNSWFENTLFAGFLVLPV